MADMIGRAVWRASRTPLGFVVAPSLSSHWNQTRTVGRCVTMCGKFSTSGLRSLERVSARQVQVLASESSSHAVVADDEGVDGVEGGVSPLSELCAGKVPEYLLRRAEELGFVEPTHVQREALPILLSGRDCILHAQTGSGKTLAYLLPIFAKVLPSRAAVQAIVVVPTRELGMQVAKVARKLAGKGSTEEGGEALKEKGTVMVMALLEGGTSSRQKAWLKAEPPQIVVGTLERIARMIETKNLRTNAITTVVIDEVDAMMGAAKEGGHLQKLLSEYTRPQQRQTILASATIPQHRRFLNDCIQNKWVKEDVTHIHVRPEDKMPSYLQHRYVVCEKDDRLPALLSLLQADAPKAAIIFVNDQSEKAKRAGNTPSTLTVAEYFSRNKIAPDGDALWEPLVLEEELHVNARTAIVSDFREGQCLLVATELAARGLDLPEVSHVYNFEWPPSVTSYIHRAGRTGRRPITEDLGTVTSFITSKELFVLRRLENELSLKFEALKVQGTARVKATPDIFP
ncbi:hypothetical protein KC19_2G263900 [Ceratodon purpureus]|uniref:RNA helicase n=1 Tax=Ceratodon purpureus TaxID=3225 RepID=A0A8T0J221_CERPU|nr:hypothetical protein KC19_2G263900 [Ceratodon purpureus]